MAHTAQATRCTRNHVAPCYRKSATCCHVAALLHELVRINAVCESTAGTSQPNRWREPSNTTAPRPVKEVTFTRPRAQEDTDSRLRAQKTKTKYDRYEPIARDWTSWSTRVGTALAAAAGPGSSSADLGALRTSAFAHIAHIQLETAAKTARERSRQPPPERSPQPLRSLHPSVRRMNVRILAPPYTMPAPQSVL